MVEQGTAEWLQERCGHVTASKFAAMMAFGRNGSELQARADYRLQIVAERITGIPIAIPQNTAMQWGSAHEAEARVAYEMWMSDRCTPVMVEQVGFIRHPTIEWVGCSPDGLIGEEGTIEIKCPYSSAVHLSYVAEARNGRAPKEHLPQIMGGLWITGRKWCDFISYDPRFPPKLGLVVVRVMRDEKAIAEIESAARKFLAEVEEEMSYYNQCMEESNAVSE